MHAPSALHGHACFVACPSMVSNHTHAHIATCPFALFHKRPACPTPPGIHQADAQKRDAAPSWEPRRHWARSKQAATRNEWRIKAHVTAVRAKALGPRCTADCRAVPEPARHGKDGTPRQDAGWSCCGRHGVPAQDLCGLPPPGAKGCGKRTRIMPNGRVRHALLRVLPRGIHWCVPGMPDAHACRRICPLAARCAARGTEAPGD